MIRKILRGVAISILVSGMVFAGGCDLFQVKGKGFVKATYGDKVLVDKQVEFESLEEMPGAMRELGSALAETTEILIEKLVEVPPPGEVKLADIDSSLAPFENDESVNFLLAGKKAESPEDFRYVQIGVPSYDQFFKESAELYALMYQTKQTIYNLKTLSATRLGQSQLPGGQLRQVVDSALGAGVSPHAVNADLKLRNLAQVGVVIARAARSTVTRVQQLVATGQQLVAAAPSSITNPKTVLHLDLILKGLGESLKMVGQSGRMLLEMLPSLAGF